MFQNLAQFSGGSGETSSKSVLRGAKTECESRDESRPQIRYISSTFAPVREAKSAISATTPAIVATGTC